MTKVPTMDIDKALDLTEKAYKAIKSGKNYRDMSWEYCFTEFENAHSCESSVLSNPSYLDYLALHLGFYLASWGMYRGSSFLLSFDYKIHTDAVKIVLDPKYDPLWAIDAKSLLSSTNLALLDDVSERLSDYYEKYRIVHYKLVGKFIPKKCNISQTLITKILLGTISCTPAFDRFVIEGIKRLGASTATYNKRSIEGLCYYYDDPKNYSSLENLRKKMSITATGTNYPQMKLLDMVLWNVGK